MGGDGRPGDTLFANLIGLTHYIFVGTLVNTFACLHHQEPVWLLPTEFFSADRGPPICTLFFHQRPTKRSVPKGICYNAGKRTTR